ncbi:MAG: hypothetical protein R3E79_60810 [Caldilineaceae bacterium]
MSKIDTTRLIVIFAIALMMVFFGSFPQVQGQSERRVACGDVIESEFSKDFESHFYLLKMAPRDSFSVSVVPVGDLLKSAIALFGPTGISLGTTNGYLSELPSITSGRLSARGDYKIQVANTGLYPDGSINGLQGGVGLYTLYIECELVSPIATATSSTLAPSIQSAETVNEISTPPTQNLPSFLELNKTYKFTFASSTYTMTITGLGNEGWVQVEYDNKTAWLNLNQVVLITPVED